MIPEPTITCPNGHINRILEQGAAQGMQSRVCGETLERADLRWIEYGYFHDSTHKNDIGTVHKIICYSSILWSRNQTKHKNPLILVLDSNDLLA